MVLMSAAATAAVIYAYGKSVASVGLAAGTSARAFWVIGGFTKVLCPICHEHVRQMKYERHTREHTFECPSCYDQVPFSELENHAQSHGYRCSVCYQTVPLANFGTHLDLHREELAGIRRIRDEGYQTRLEDLERECQQKMADLERAEAAYIEKREQARLLWEHLKSNCPACNETVPMPQMESHVREHKYVDECKIK
ncbi:uncharacterized protein LOC119320904 [Triticum dicoccoides]|uniref:uncharacterized protein LOC119320904 n=1 Tax=Triticum dicoccoides TaxID=85692 RepID=UPI00189114BD|nr:uncharacterized protein LOC119320904 [Triticum dicoccoides]